MSVRHLSLSGENRLLDANALIFLISNVQLLIREIWYQSVGSSSCKTACNEFLIDFRDMHVCFRASKNYPDLRQWKTHKH